MLVRPTSPLSITRSVHFIRCLPWSWCSEGNCHYTLLFSNFQVPDNTWAWGLYLPNFSHLLANQTMAQRSQHTLVIIGHSFVKKLRKKLCHKLCQLCPTPQEACPAKCSYVSYAQHPKKVLSYLPQLKEACTTKWKTAV